MAKITVFLEGTKFMEQELDTGREYLLGRATSCDIVLAHPKVSRQHVKISFDGQNWCCSVLSKSSAVEVNGNTMTEAFSLVGGSKFSIPPYEIEFEQGAEGQPAAYHGAPEVDL